VIQELDTAAMSPAVVEHHSDAAAKIAFRRLVPFLLVGYIVAWIDRVNVGFAALQMNHQLGFTPAVYGFGAGVFFIGYALFEVPSNLLLYRVGARRWFARIMITWGLLGSAMALVHGATSFYVLRFLLGVAEAGFFPGVIFYLGNWFPSSLRARAVAGFMTANPLSSAIGGPLAGLLLTLDSKMGLAGWQWLFLIEGIPAVVLGVVVLVYLPDTPADARWLSPEQRAALSERVRREDVAGKTHEATLAGALRHPGVWRLGIIYCLGSVGSYGLILWLPEILKGWSGYSNVVVGFASAIPYIVAAIATVLIGVHSDRTHERRLHAGVPCLIATVGFLGSALVHSPWLGLVGITLAAVGVFGKNGPFWAIPREFLCGPAAAGGLALINTVGALGGFLGPYAVGLVRHFSGQFTGGLLVLAGSLLVSGLMTLTLRRESLLVRANSQRRL
jgi:ACS family tartrate transporter-like MFS transporter